MVFKLNNFVNRGFKSRSSSTLENQTSILDSCSGKILKASILAVISGATDKTIDKIRCKTNIQDLQKEIVKKKKKNAVLDDHTPLAQTGIGEPRKRLEISKGFSKRVVGTL